MRMIFVSSSHGLFFGRKSDVSLQSRSVEHSTLDQIPVVLLLRAMRESKKSCPAQGPGMIVFGR
jgi:hypothetical protein